MLRKSSFLFVAALLILTCAGASAQTTIHVIPGATPALSGTNLLNALADVVGNSSVQPFVLKLDPGIYDVGSTPVAMKPFVDIEGSGQASTTIRGLGNNIGFLTAVVLGANNSELRDLRVVSLGRDFDNSIAVLLNNVNTSVRDVTLISSDATANWGLRNLAANSSLQNLTIDARGGSEAYGLAFTGASLVTAPKVQRAVIRVFGASSGHGIYADQSAAPVVRDVEISVSGGTNGFGLRYEYGFGGLSSFALHVTNVSVFVSGTSGLALGIEVTGSGNTFTVTHSNLSAVATAGGGVGIRSLAGAVGTVFFIDHCDVRGGSNSVSAPAAGARMGASRLTGLVNVGSPVCAASFNGSYVPLNGACL